MLKFGILLAVFGATVGVDLTGCYPSPPKEINAFFQSVGEVSSPGFKEGQNYPENLYCEYMIRAPYGFRLKLTFTDLDIDPADMCSEDAVEVVERESQPGNQPLTHGIFCGNQTNPPLVTQSNVVTILFRSDFMVGRRGFRIKYDVSKMPSVCNPLSACRNRNCYSAIQRCNGRDDCGDGTDEENCGFPLVAAECGIRKILGHYGYDRVVGGKEAGPGSWPWQADLQISIFHPNGHNCGGTLINSQWVVTAAHCFGYYRIPQMSRIHLGKHHKFIKDESEQIRYAERIIVYPGVTGNDLLGLPDVDMTNDLALIKLNAPVKITDKVRPACLPAQGYEVRAGTKCMASGWGMTRGTGANRVLKELSLTIQPPDVCNGDTGPINQTTMICVRNSEGFHDACHGDSGGPLVCELNGKWTVMGATSFGSKSNFMGGLCALKGSATIYSKVSHKTTWINQQINQYS